MKIKYLSILPIVAVFVLSGFSFANAQSDVFTQNLYYGLQNNSQVTQLQEFLTSQNLYSGPITGNYYFLTLSAVKAFQTQQGITPATGYFGPITMAAANKIADATVGASNNEAITETGTSTPPVVTASTTPQLQLAALLQEVALLQQQLQAQQSSTQALQQIASNTQSITTTPSQPSQSPAPSATFTVNGSQVITIPYNTAATISWSSTNANSCNISPSGWSGASGNQSTGNLTASQTYSLSCSGAGGSTSASVTVNVAAQISCTLTGTLSNVATSSGVGGNIGFDWTLQGMDPSTAGTLYAWKPAAPSSPTAPWYSTPIMLDNSTRNNATLWGLGASDAWKAVFGSATCYAFFHDPYTSSNTQYFFNGATSSPTPLESYQQSLIL